MGREIRLDRLTVTSVAVRLLPGELSIMADYATVTKAVDITAATRVSIG